MLLLLIVPLEKYKDKVFYVWFDNVIGYISATYELLGEEALELWKNKEVKTYYFLGKDNIPFHTIFWPGQIIGQKEFVLPYNVVGYQYLNFQGKKFSKSKKIGIFADQAINSKISLDYWRFYLTNILPETKDTDFSVEDFQERINKELIGNFGNFVNRTLNFVWNKFEGKVQKITKIDEELEKEIYHRIKKIEESYERCDLREALQEILKLSDLGNQYFNQKEPWKTNDKEALAYCYEICRILSLLFSPIIPDSTGKLKIFLNTKNKELKIDRREKTINKPEILFKKLENEDVEKFK